jgi:hypothetical protein
MQIVTRAQWGSVTPNISGRNVPLSSRRFYVGHWPVMGARDERQWCRDIERIHRGQGWACIGYNFVVGQSGTVYEGAGLMNRGIHSPPRNVDGFGVCFLQPSTANGTPTAPISQAMRNGGRALYEWLCQQTGRRLTMSWHGRDFATACPGPDVRNWISSGMPATGGAGPAPPTPEPEEEEMVTSVVAGGQTLVFAVNQNRDMVGVTWQGTNALEWAGRGRGGAGWPAGMQPFARAPAGHTITGIVALVAATGVLHVFVRTNRAETFVTWQNRDGWQGRGGGFHAAFQHFAARP